MILSFINIRYVTRGVSKTSGYALGFHLANVNEWKIMFDPCIETNNFTLKLHVTGKLEYVLVYEMVG